MKHKFFILFLFLVLLSSFVCAKQDVIEGTGTNLRIIHPISDFVPLNSEFWFNIHAVNSTGFVLNNSNVDCIIHVYNETLNHLVSAWMLKHPNGIDLYFPINQTTTGSLGVRPYNIFCNNSEGGFLSYSFEVTKTGKDPESMFKLVIAYIIGVSAIFAILLYISFKLDNKHIALKFFFVSFVIYAGITITRSLYLLEPTGITLDLITYYMRLVYFFSAYMFLAFIWALGEYYGKTSGIKNWFKDKMGRKGYD